MRLARFPCFPPIYRWYSHFNARFIRDPAIFDLLFVTQLPQQAVDPDEAAGFRRFIFHGSMASHWGSSLKGHGKRFLGFLGAKRLNHTPFGSIWGHFNIHKHPDLELGRKSSPRGSVQWFCLWLFEEDATLVEKKVTDRWNWCQCYQYVYTHVQSYNCICEVGAHVYYWKTLTRSLAPHSEANMDTQSSWAPSYITTEKQMCVHTHLYVTCICKHKHTDR